MKEFSGILGLRMRLEMDTTHKIESLDEVCMLDPFNLKQSAETLQENISLYDFFTTVYPDEIVDKHL